MAYFDVHFISLEAVRRVSATSRDDNKNDKNGVNSVL